MGKIKALTRSSTGRLTAAGDAHVDAPIDKIIVAFKILLVVQLKIHTGGCKMGKLSNIIPVSDLRQDAAKLLKQLQTSEEPLIITQRGRASAVMLGVGHMKNLNTKKKYYVYWQRAKRKLKPVSDMI